MVQVEQPGAPAAKRAVDKAVERGGEERAVGVTAVGMAEAARAAASRVAGREGMMAVAAKAEAETAVVVMVEGGHRSSSQRSRTVEQQTGRNPVCFAPPHKWQARTDCYTSEG